MARKTNLQALQEALPAGVTITHSFRAEPPLRRQLPRIFLGGLIFAALRRGARYYAIGLTDDALLVLPLPRRPDDAGVTVVRGAELRAVRLKRGLMRAKIDIDTPTARYHLRVPGLAANGSAREALKALRQRCTATQPI